MGAVRQSFDVGQLVVITNVGVKLWNADNKLFGPCISGNVALVIAPGDTSEYVTLFVNGFVGQIETDFIRSL